KTRHRETHALGRSVPATSEKDGAVVRSKIVRQVVRTVVGKPYGSPSCCGHGINIKISVAVAGKSYGISVVAPYRPHIISLSNGNGNGYAPFGPGAIQVSHITENYSLSIRGNRRIPQPTCVFLGE